MEHILESPNSFALSESQVRSNPITSDEQAIRMCQQGNRQAYGFLVQRYMKRAYYSALGIVGSHDAALDLSQDAFVRAFRAIKKFDTNRQFFTWYYQILRNLCLNFIRDKKRHARSFSEMDDYQMKSLSDESQDASRAVEQSELKTIMWQAINSLKPNEREIIVLKDFQDLPYKEIAEILNIPIGTVMSRLFNARKALKAKLERTFV